MSGRLTVLDARAAVVTDLGRFRGPQLGLPVNGALDQYSARAANLLVANPEDAPLIEITAFDLSFTVDIDVLIAVTGAPMEVGLDGEPVPMWEPVPVRAGSTVSLTEMVNGMRCYVAIHGSLTVPRLVGSCAPDTVLGFGTVLDAGTVVELASAPLPVCPYLGISLFNLDLYRPHHGETAVVDVVDGPDIDEFDGTAHRLFERSFTMSPNSNHIGLRLGGGTLPVRVRRTEMISRGVPVGAVEVPPGEELLILHRGRGVTAGYPVLGVVTSTSLDTLAQVRPGQAVRFRRIEADQAGEDTRFWRETLAALRDRMAVVFASLGLAHLVTRTPRGPSHSSAAAATETGVSDPMT